MVGDAFKKLLNKRETAEFKARSKQAQLNIRGGDPDGVVEPSYYRGSQSAVERMELLQAVSMLINFLLGYLKVEKKIARITN